MKKIIITLILLTIVLLSTLSYFYIYKPIEERKELEVYIDQMEIYRHYHIQIADRYYYGFLTEEDNDKALNYLKNEALISYLNHQRRVAEFQVKNKKIKDVHGIYEMALDKQLEVIKDYIEAMENEDLVAFHYAEQKVKKVNAYFEIYEQGLVELIREYEIDYNIEKFGER